MRKLKQVQNPLLRGNYRQNMPTNGQRYSLRVEGVVNGILQEVMDKVPTTVL